MRCRTVFIRISSRLINLRISGGLELKLISLLSTYDFNLESCLYMYLADFQVYFRQDLPVEEEEQEMPLRKVFTKSFRNFIFHQIK